VPRKEFTGYRLAAFFTIKSSILGIDLDHVQRSNLKNIYDLDWKRTKQFCFVKHTLSSNKLYAGEIKRRRNIIIIFSPIPIRLPLHFFFTTLTDITLQFSPLIIPFAHTQKKTQFLGTLWLTEKTKWQQL
jgi:hypothetical protein